MMSISGITLCLLCAYVGASQDHFSTPEQWLEWFNHTATLEMEQVVTASWDYDANITDENFEKKTQADARHLAFELAAADNASSYLKSDLRSKPVIERMLRKISKTGLRLNEEDSLRYSTLIANMTTIYDTAEVCSMDGVSLKIDCSKQWQLNPDLEEIFKNSRNFDLLSYVWKTWHENIGRPMLPLYKEMIELSNKGARNDGYKDTGDYWRSFFEEPEIQSMLEELWHEILPLYEQLHAYVRRKLRQQYPKRCDTNAIPAHVLGSIWSQEWTSIADFTIPYPNKPSIDVTNAMIRQNYTAEKIFRVIDDFYKSMGLRALTPTFWEKSILEKPTDREISCSENVYDFYRYNDVRMRMCTVVDMRSLIWVSYMLGYAQYYLQYTDQPFPFRDAPNLAFLDSIGSTIMLSSNTPQYLQKIGLLDDYVPDAEQDINVLFRIALEHIAFAPYGYFLDQWRWAVFNGSVKFEDWNSKWWELRHKYQGIVPPVDRKSGTDFDAGAKIHIPQNTAYIDYFVAIVLQFEFHEAMCKAAGHQGPLHQCQVFNSTAAGDLIGKMMKMGSSQSWKEALHTVVGRRKISAAPLIHYFEPLMKWLEKENKNECFGWGYTWPDKVTATLKQPRCK